MEAQIGAFITFKGPKILKDVDCIMLLGMSFYPMVSSCSLLMSDFGEDVLGPRLGAHP